MMKFYWLIKGKVEELGNTPERPLVELGNRCSLSLSKYVCMCVITKYYKYRCL